MSILPRNPPSPPDPHPVQFSFPRVATLLSRGARLRCPNCGGGPLFSKWVKMREICPGCQMILDRGESDYFMGGYTVNFIVAELLIVFGAAVTMILTWPQVPWKLLTRVLIFLMVLAPIIFYPFAKNLWLSVDLIIRPLTVGDLAGPGEEAGSDHPPGEGPQDSSWKSS